MGWACGYTGEDKEYVKNFSSETSWKTTTWKMSRNWKITLR
jgi:hypothetical protein